VHSGGVDAHVWYFGLVQALVKHDAGQPVRTADNLPSCLE